MRSPQGEDPATLSLAGDSRGHQGGPNLPDVRLEAAQPDMVPRRRDIKRLPVKPYRETPFGSSVANEGSWVISISRLVT